MKNLCSATNACREEYHSVIYHQIITRILWFQIKKDWSSFTIFQTLGVADISGIVMSKQNTVDARYAYIIVTHIIQMWIFFKVEYIIQTNDHWLKLSLV